MDKLREDLTQLRSEAAIFERLMYKNKSQHRSTLHFRRLLQVRRNLRLLHSATSDDFLAALGRHLHPQIPKSSRRGTPSKSESKGSLMNSLLGISRISAKVNFPILGASKKLAGLLGQRFFMSFALTVLSLLARIRVITFQLLLDTVAVYNLLASDLSRGSSLIPFNKLQQELPSSLECKWDGMQYELKETKADAQTCWFVDDRSDKQITANPPGIVYESGQKPRLSSAQNPLLNQIKACSSVPGATPIPSASPAATEFLEFIDKPTPVTSKSVAYLSVTGSTSTLSGSTPDPAETSSSKQRDSLFDLLFAGRSTESIF